MDAMAICYECKVSNRAKENSYRIIIAVSLFITQLLTFGISYCIGIFQHVFLEVFEHGSGITSWVGSLNQGIACASGPLGSWLVNRYGSRWTLIIGGTLSAAGLAISSAATNLYIIMAAFGVVSGIGYGITYLLTMNCTVIHFPDRSRTLVQSIVLTGIGAGTFVNPYIVVGLTEAYGWRGGMLITAGLSLHVNAAGALLRDPEIPGVCSTYSEANVGDVNQNELVLSDTKLGDPCVTVVSINSVHKLQSGNCTDHPEKTTAAEPASDQEHVDKCTSSHAEDQHTSPEIQGDKFWRNRPQKLSINSSSLRVNDHAAATSSFRPNNKSLGSLLSPAFLLLFISCFLLCYGLLIFFTHFVVYAIQSCAQTEAEASTLVSVHGFASIVGRIFFGALMTKFNANPQVTMCFCLLLCSTATFLMTVMTSWHGLFACVAVHGFVLMPVYGPIISELCIKVVGKSNYSYGYGIVMVAMASGLLLGPPCAGWLYDATQEYRNSFYLGGSSFALSAMSVVPMILRPAKLFNS